MKPRLVETDDYWFEIEVFNTLKKGDSYLTSDKTIIESCEHDGYAGHKIVAYKPKHDEAKKFDIPNISDPCASLLDEILTLRKEHAALIEVAAWVWEEVGYKTSSQTWDEDMVDEILKKYNKL